MDCVVLLHGLARTSGSMQKLETRLVDEGYKVVNINYPSRHKNIAELSELAVGEGLRLCQNHTAHVVTHSLGGILVRQYVKQHGADSAMLLGRVVMLGPPNQGSEIVDKLKDVPGYQLFNGPAGLQLGTRNSDLPKSLGVVEFELGVIAGTRSLSLILSQFLPKPNDGKVSVQSTRVEGMSDFISLPVSHTFMMRNQDVMDEVVNFLKLGKFTHTL